MATNAWVDWSQLPADISRRITKEAVSGPGSYGHTANMYAQEGWRGDPSDVGGSTWGAHGEMRGELRAAQVMRSQHRVRAGESFHPMADEWTPTERFKYAAMTAAAVTSLGLGLSRWPTKATANEQPGTRKSQSLESDAHVGEMMMLRYNASTPDDLYYSQYPRRYTLEPYTLERLRN